MKRAAWVTYSARSTAGHAVTSLEYIEVFHATDIIAFVLIIGSSVEGPVVNHESLAIKGYCLIVGSSFAGTASLGRELPATREALVASSAAASSA